MNPFDKFNEVEKTILTEYFINKKTLREVAEDNPQLGIRHLAVRDMILRLGFSPRTLSQSKKLYYKKQREKKKKKWTANT